MNEENIKIKKTTLYVAGIFILILVGGFLILKGSPKPITDDVTDVPSDSQEGVQKVVLSMKNYNYYPNTITVKAGEPVRIYLDKSVVGCYRSFTMKDFGIAKYLASPSDYVEFTPTKAGTHRFACSMGMGTGTLVVE